MRILVVDDERSLREALEMMLTRAGFEFTGAPSATRGLELFDAHGADAAILDVMLPDMDGFSLCAELRHRSARLPILMLSARGDTPDRKEGLRSGADDYLAKPFDEEELLLRIEALLRRAEPPATPSSTGRDDAPPLREAVPGLAIDYGRYEVEVREKRVKLTPKEFAIVELLASRPGAVFTREDIIDGVWGPDFRDGSVSIPTYVRHIREKLEEDPADPVLVQTVFGFGYRLGR